MEDLSFLSESDKEIYLNSRKTHNIDLCKTMSIFYQNGEYKTIHKYRYYVPNKLDRIYYLPFGALLGIFIDQDKKILFDSRWFFALFKSLINHLRMILRLLQKINLEDNVIDLNTNIIACEKWFPNYGHIKDELFICAHFYDTLCDDSYSLLLYYAHSKFKEIDYIVNNNYRNSINGFDYKQNILKINNLILIEHRIVSPMFHSFPKSITDKLMKNVPETNITNKKIFITRTNIINGLQRLLSNFKEIENYFKLQNYLIINPENISYVEFINQIRNADLIITTWGSALTNIIYLKENTKIIILKSQSYMHESIGLWKKIIDAYNLNVKEIRSINNYIDPLLIE
uniref:Glycosyltransferase 61 catalytic domain-containing protein n=1 Tax=viral metagenome TaxID=1070528 RepID=A0A6C0I9J5_9ZZZZ